MTPEEKLDEALEALLETKSTFLPMGVYNNMKSKNKIDEYEIHGILHKLLEDKNVYLHHLSPSDTIPGYRISFNGIVLLENGGYKELKIIKELERKRLLNLESSVDKLKRDELRLTKILIAATLLPSLYALIEIVKFVYSLYHSSFGK